ncbi:MAG: thioredoxin, partial [Actinobacteria bacterium]|nr:thioredoxin [Actinomycetota bacterium]NIS29486.1 thioredoxin [Actinomycetota bacterium]NIT94552.1 thioredoxin [Actinomycetota bacterium]NIU18162.1 thioredoxin [Actinomycetota bacterium]NIU64836.1 thioredoxin [Actinomycetota bacterium]
PESLTRHLAQMLVANVSPRMAFQMETVVVLSPEHMNRYRDAGWDRARFLEELRSHLQLDGDDIVEGAGGIEEGMPAALAGAQLPKFPPDGIHVVHGGGGAGLFSTTFGGWVSGPMGSVTVTREIVR